MQLHAWIIASWPIIERPTALTADLARELQHLGTTVSDDCDEYGRFSGHTIWGAGAPTIGIAWDWVEAHDGVFALSDPMGVVSNLGFLDRDGYAVPEFMSAVQLNQVTHELPWQSEVAKATQGMRELQPWSDRVGPRRLLAFKAGEGAIETSSAQRLGAAHA